MPLQAGSTVTLEYVAVLGECCPPGRDSSFNLIALNFVSGAVSLSQVDVAFNVLDLSVVDIYWYVGYHHHLCLRPSSDPDCHFHQLIHVPFVVAHVVY